MSVKKDESGRRSIQVEVEVPGTPEEVWEAIATGPGVSSWFVPTEFRDDGTVVCKFGPGMESVATGTAWDPPRRFAKESDLGPGVPKMATEWIVEARSGGTCLVRVVHSLFAGGDDWDNQLEGAESGWPAWFRILRLYLTHFRGLPCSAIHVMGIAPGPASAAWDTLMAALGLSGVPAGGRWHASAGVPPTGGVVEGADDGEPLPELSRLIRLDEPTPGIASLSAHGMGGQVYLALAFYLYGDRAADAVARDEPRWQAWLNGQFPGAGDPSQAH